MVRARARPAAPRRRALDLRPVTIVCDAVPHAEGSCLVTQGRTQVLVTATVEAKVPPFLQKTGPRLGDGRVRDAAAGHARASSARGRARQAVGPRRSRSSASSAARSARRRGPLAASRTGRSRSTATSSSPTPERAAPPSRARTSRSRWRCAARSRRQRSARNPLREAVAARLASASDGGRRSSSTSTTPRTRRPTSTCNVVGTSSGAFVEIQGTAEQRAVRRGAARRAARGRAQGARRALSRPARRARTAGFRRNGSARWRPPGRRARSGVREEIAKGRRRGAEGLPEGRSARSRAAREMSRPFAPRESRAAPSAGASGSRAPGHEEERHRRLRRRSASGGAARTPSTGFSVASDDLLLAGGPSARRPRARRSPLARPVHRSRSPRRSSASSRARSRGPRGGTSPSTSGVSVKPYGADPRGDTSASAVTRRGASAAISPATRPPREWPARKHGLLPISPRTQRASASGSYPSRDAGPRRRARQIQRAHREVLREELAGVRPVGRRAAEAMQEDEDCFRLLGGHRAESYRNGA